MARFWSAGSVRWSNDVLHRLAMTGANTPLSCLTSQVGTGSNEHCFAGALFSADTAMTSFGVTGLNKPMIENLHNDEIVAKHVIFHSACAETARNTCGTKSDHAIRSIMPKKCVFDKLWLKTLFKGFMRHVCTTHAQKGQHTTPGFKHDHAIRPYRVQNLYSQDILGKTPFLGDLAPYFDCACAEAARKLRPISNLITPFNLVCPKTFIVAKCWLKRNLREF